MKTYLIGSSSLENDDSISYKGYSDQQRLSDVVAHHQVNCSTWKQTEKDRKAQQNDAGDLCGSKRTARNKQQTASSKWQAAHNLLRPICRRPRSSDHLSLPHAVCLSMSQFISMPQINSQELGLISTFYFSLTSV